MVIETQSSYVTPVGGNVFADLGFNPEEAVRLKAKSAKIIAERIALKESLAIELTQWIDAEVLGVTRPRVSDLVNKSLKRQG